MTWSWIKFSVIIRVIRVIRVPSPPSPFAIFHPAGPGPEIYWTNWFNLHPLLKGARNLLDWERPILRDLRLLLERKRLVHFQGFSGLRKLSLIESGGVYQASITPHAYRFDLTPVKDIPGFYWR